MEVAERKKVVAPKLRFREFDSPWNRIAIGTIIDFLAGHAFSSKEMKSEPDRFQLIKMSNVYKSELRLDRSPSYWGNLEASKNKFLLSKGDVVLTLTGTVNKYDYGYSVAIPYDEEFLLNQRLVRLREVNGKSCNGFNLYLVQTSRFFYHFFAISKGGTGNQSNVGIDDLKEIELPLPSLPEQEKIASFLSAVDARIQQLGRKKELLEAYKKGVMQQLFSQELRFKKEDGSDYPDWEERNFLSCFGTISTKQFQILAKEILEEGTYPVIDQGKERIAGYSNTEEKLYSNSGVIVFGDHTTELKFIDFSFIVGADGTKLLNSKGPVLKFLYYALCHSNVEQEGYKRHFSILKKKSFSIPESNEEQQKIADFLSAIDQKIAAVSAQIEHSQSFKKGLLQQMFV